jgi:hypothetical protein
MYGLPEAGILSKKLRRTRLAQDGYFELPHTTKPQSRDKNLAAWKYDIFGSWMGNNNDFFHSTTIQEKKTWQITQARHTSPHTTDL